MDGMRCATFFGGSKFMRMSFAHLFIAKNWKWSIDKRTINQMIRLHFMLCSFIFSQECIQIFRANVNECIKRIVYLILNTTHNTIKKKRATLCMISKFVQLMPLKCELFLLNSKWSIWETFCLHITNFVVCTDNVFSMHFCFELISMP